MKKPLVYLLIILIVATILRVYQLDKVPPSLFGDEVDVGYQAYSLLKTGKDLYGNPWPSLIHSLSEYRAPLFIYSDIPFVAIFGLNEWGVRLAAVFWGVLGVLGIYFLTKKLFNEKIGFLAAGFLTLSPWHIQYSRAAFEVTMLLTFFIFATYFFIKSLEKRHYLIISAIFFGLTPYIYSTAAVFMPLLILLLFLIFKQNIKQKLTTLTIGTIVMILILAPYGLQTISGKSGERFSVISVFTNQYIKDQVLIAQKSEQLSLNFQKVFHNKPVAWMNQLSINYLRAFSPEFLFLQGDPNGRHSVHEMGQMYYFELVLLGFGVFVLFRLQAKTKWLTLGWLVLAPIPAALTYDGGFHATRNFLMLVPLVTLCALGGNFLLEKLKKIEFRYIAGVVILLAVFNMTFYLHRYFVHYPNDQWRAWHFGFKEAMHYVAQNGSSYDRVLINNTYEPSLIRFLFWTKYDPDTFHQKFTLDQSVKNITNGFDGFSLDNKYFFGKVNGPFEQIINSRTLYLASARNDITNPTTLYLENVKLLDTIYSPTGEPIFYIITGTK